MYYLYVKTHNKTGLKYLGQTCKDPFKYKGSGKYWIRHIKQHGNDVTTTILTESEKLADISAAGLFYSNMFDVVNSCEWANLIPEAGTGGHNPASKTSEAKHKRIQTLKQNGKKWTHNEQSRKRMSKAAKDYWTSNKSADRKGKEFFGPPKPPGWYINNQSKYQCPHCSKTGDLRNMKRWHFDNCKLNPKGPYSSAQKVSDHS